MKQTTPGYLQKKQCDKCNRKISVPNFNKHYNNCDGKIKISIEIYKTDDGYKCPYCGLIKSKKGIYTHIWRNHLDDGIKHNQKTKTSFNEYRLKVKSGIIPRSLNQYEQAKKEGKVYSLSQESRDKISKSLKGKSVHTEESKKRLSDVINERYNNGWVPKSGRCKHILYDSTIAGVVHLAGSWEYKVAIYLDKNSYNWRRNIQKFDYIFDNKNRKYTPDFYLPDLDLYIEVKGYETDKDRSKWSQFTNNLEVWNKSKLIELGIL